MADGRTGALDFDPDALREKYRAGARQAPPRRRQRPVPRGRGRVRPLRRRPVRRARIRRASRSPTRSTSSIIGGGFGGLLAGARLREAGVDDIRIDREGRRLRRHLVLEPLSRARCATSSRTSTCRCSRRSATSRRRSTRRAPEILEHSQRDRRALRPLRRRAASRPRSPSCAGTTTRRAGSSRPTAATHARPLRRHGERAAAPAEAAGHPRHRDVRGPHVPHQPLGLRLHRRRRRRRTSTGCADKRVGIIGTGATAVQCVPHLGEAAEQLYVFQRTPSSIDVRANRPTDPEWAASLEPGWQQQRMDNFNILVSGGVAGRGPRQRRLDRHHRQAARACSARTAPASSPPRRWRRRWSWPTSRRWSRSAPASTRSSTTRTTAEALKPCYRQFCKRPCFHDEYLDTFNRPNVTLVDTDGQGVERITEHGVVVDGVEYELDCLIFATGFEVGTDYTRRAGYELDRPRRRHADARSGPTALRRCTACTAAASRTASSSASRSRASR